MLWDKFGKMPAFYDKGTEIALYRQLRAWKSSETQTQFWHFWTLNFPWTPSVEFWGIWGGRKVERKAGSGDMTYSHFSLVRTISGKEKILYYRELLVSENFFKTRWIPLALPSPVILGEKNFHSRELLVSEKFLYNIGFPLWFYSLRRVSGLFWAKSKISFFFKFIHWFKICNCLKENCTPKSKALIW